MRENLVWDIRTFVTSKAGLTKGVVFHEGGLSKGVPLCKYSQTWLQSHCLQHQPLYNNTHGRNGFNGLCTKCPGYNNNLVITAHFSGTKGVVVN